MRDLGIALIPGFLVFSMSGCDQGNTTVPDTGEDPVEEGSLDAGEEEPEPEAVQDPEEELPQDPAAPFAILELFTSEG
jgi:hypothetical protein